MYQEIKPPKADLFILTELMLCAVIVISTLMQRSDITSTAFTLSFVVLLYQLVKYFIINITSPDILFIFFITLISGTGVLFTGLRYNKAINFEYLKEWFIFLSTIFFFKLVTEREVNKKTVSMIMFINVGIAAMYPYAYFFLPQETKFNDLYLNFTNPNLTAMWLLQSVLYMIIGFIIYNKFIYKIIFLGLLAIDFWLMYKTGARNTLLALVLFIGILIWIFIKDNFKFSNGFSLFLVTMPGIFVPVYLILIDFVVEKGWLDFLVSEGKSLTSRVGVWTKFFNRVNGNWLLGNYAYASGNAHNAYMTVLCSFGIIILILTIVFLYKIVKKINEENIDRKQAYCLVAFFAVLFMGIGEAALFSGGVGVYILAGSFLVLARYDFKEFNVEREELFR